MVVDSNGKGKVLESPSSKSMKRRLVKTWEEEPKKIKLLASVMPTVDAVEVCVCLCLHVLNALARLSVFFVFFRICLTFSFFCFGHCQIEFAYSHLVTFRLVTTLGCGEVGL